MRWLTSFISSFFWVVEAALAADYWSPRTTALGGAGRAQPILTDAIYMNPSFPSFNTFRAISGGYQFLGPHEGGKGIWNVSALDATPDSFFQAGVGLTIRPDSNWIHLTGSKLLLKNITLGLGWNGVFLDKKPTRLLHDGSLGVTGSFWEWLTVALVVDHLFETQKEYGAYREFNLGTRINLSYITYFYGDFQWHPSRKEGPIGFSLGSEIPFFKDFFARAGGYWGVYIPHLGANQTGFSIGAGWIGPKLSIEYAYLRTLEPTLQGLHQVGLTLYF
jgi:hypothetical protein